MSGVTSTMRRCTLAARRATASLTAVPSAWSTSTAVQACSGNSAAATISSGTILVRAPQRCRCRAINDASIAPGATMRTSSPVRLGTVSPGSWIAPERACEPDGAAHSFENAFGDGQAKTVAAVLSRGAAVGLLELEKNPRAVFGRDADAGVAYRDGDLVRLSGRFDDDRDAAVLGELEGVASEIEQHLAQPCGIANHMRREAFVHVAADFQAFGLGAWTQQFDGLLDKRLKRERLRGQIEPPRFDLGEIENLVDQRQQRLA